jgi:hypothetical protein
MIRNLSLNIEKENVMILNDSMQELSLEQTAEVNGGFIPFIIASSEMCVASVVLSVMWITD